MQQVTKLTGSQAGRLQADSFPPTLAQASGFFCVPPPKWLGGRTGPSLGMTGSSIKEPRAVRQRASKGAAVPWMGQDYRRAEQRQVAGRG